MAARPRSSPADTGSPMKVLFVVTHLLGSGHLSRVLTLARAVNGAGHRAVVISGGMPAPHLDANALDLHQLPPLRSDGVDFTRLLDDKGDVADPAYHGARQKMMTEVLTRESPDVLITELFPFGRRSLKTEFASLLDTAQKLQKKPLILASIRDILAPPSKPRKVTFASDMIEQFYDGVLVHADPQITLLDLSWPVDEMLRPYLHYTGFVAPSPASRHPQEAGRDEIIVSAGGGNVGQALFEAALAAARLVPTRKWRVLVGGADGAARAESLQATAPENAVVEAARRDFRQMLHHAAASVSMCGYNTAQDVLQTGCPAVFVPFDAGQEVEQSIRAAALAELDGIEVLASGDLTPQRLVHAVDVVQSAPVRSARTGTGGAAQTFEIMRQLWEERP